MPVDLLDSVGVTANDHVYTCFDKPATQLYLILSARLLHTDSPVNKRNDVVGSLAASFHDSSHMHEVVLANHRVDDWRGPGLL